MAIRIKNMNKLDKVRKQHELAVATDFALFISTEREKYSVFETPDPPDAILKSEHGDYVWLEVTDVFRDAEEARVVYSYATDSQNFYDRKAHVIVAPDMKVTSATIMRVEKKLEKDSYQKVTKKYGKGVLLLWIYDPLFTVSTLQEIAHSFEGASLSSEYFETIYIYWPDTTFRRFKKVL